ncbi:hypothetical protein Tco_0216940 [Tanacetum coccineum]
MMNNQAFTIKKSMSMPVQLSHTQDGERPQVDDQRFGLADDLNEAQIHISTSTRQFAQSGIEPPPPSQRNHGVLFTKPPKIRYKGGKVNWIDNIDSDAFSFNKEMLKFVSKYKVIDLYVDHYVCKEPVNVDYSISKAIIAYEPSYLDKFLDNDADEVLDDVSENECLQESLRKLPRFSQSGGQSCNNVDNVGQSSKNVDNVVQANKNVYNVVGMKRISDKRTKNQAKTDKTEHGMEKHGKAKVKSKPKSTPTKSKPRSHQVKENTTLGTKFAKS